MTQTAAPPMTAADAQSFDHYSQTNAAAVTAAFDCGCQPYEDVFTYRRWKAQGYQVQRGQKGTKITTYRTIEKDNGDKTSIPKTSSVFCRCQVKPIEN